MNFQFQKVLKIHLPDPLASVFGTNLFRSKNTTDSNLSLQDRQKGWNESNTSLENKSRKRARSVDSWAKKTWLNVKRIFRRQFQPQMRVVTEVSQTHFVRLPLWPKKTVQSCSLRFGKTMKKASQDLRIVPFRFFFTQQQPCQSEAKNASVSRWNQCEITGVCIPN